MGFRRTTRIRIMPGLTLNVSRSGIGYSAGGRGYRVTRRADGRTTRTVGVPGTRVRTTSTVSGSRTGSSRSRTTRPVPPPPPAPPKPTLLGPAWEKDLHKQLGKRKPEGWAAVAVKHRGAPGVGVLCASLDGLGHYQQVVAGQGDEFRARELLGWAAANGGGDLALHPFVVKYLAERTWQVDIAGGVSAELTLADDVVLLAAAELHQAAGDLDAAIWVVEQAEPTSASALSLAELYLDAGRFEEAIEVTDGLTNTDDPTALLVVFRGRALAQLGRFDAAREALKESLRFKSRLPAIRHRALLERSEVNLAVNRKAAARKDLETILAEDSTFPGLREALDALPG